MSVIVPRGVQGDNSSAQCSYDPTVPLNKTNMIYYPGGTCPIEMNKQGMNWILSAIYQVIDNAGLALDAPGVCDSDKFLLAINQLISPCGLQPRDMNAAPLNENSYFVVQDCPSGTPNRVPVSSILNIPAPVSSILNIPAGAII